MAADSFNTRPVHRNIMGDATPKRVLLGSGGIATAERKELYIGLVGDHFSDCSEVLFVPFASDDHEGYTSRMQDFMGPEGPSLVSIHSLPDPLTAVMESDGIYVGGGNSFLLVRELHERELMAPIRERASEGVPYLGVSAGANVACPTMMTTNDMPIVLPPSFESLGIVPFQINPHYHPGKILYTHEGEVLSHFGESRGQRISEFHRHDTTPVLGMWEGSFIRWDGSKGRLSGRATAFLPDTDPVDLEDGSEFDSRLSRV